jgi:hypothetical protein
MIFNGGMTIWILAFVLIAALTLAGWRQGAIRALFTFVGVLIAILLAVPVGHLLHPVIGLLGVSNPLIVWALGPVVGFLVVSIAFTVAAQPVHKRVEHFYRYNAGDLRHALWERLNTRVGICVGVLNGVLYFILASFLFFNLAYLTTQISGAAKQPLLVRWINSLGGDMRTTGFSRTACAVGSMPENFYQLANLAGFLVQNPQVGPRFVEYPALTSLWERDDMQSLVTDSTLTNALASGASLGEIMSDPNVKEFLKNKDQTRLVEGILTTNLADLTEYLKTGKSAKYDPERIIGVWGFNPSVTLAWLRQSRPKMPSSEMRMIRAVWSQAYANTHILITGDNQIFIKNYPKFQTQAQPNQPLFQSENWKGDWTASGTSYDLHITGGGDEKFFSATADEFRLTVKDGKNMLIFNRLN